MRYNAVVATRNLSGTASLPASAMIYDQKIGNFNLYTRRGPDGLPIFLDSAFWLCRESAVQRSKNGIARFPSYDETRDRDPDPVS